MIFKILQVIIILSAPFFSKWLVQQHLKWLSPVVICYAIGILLGNLKPFPIDAALARTMSEVGILFAIPLLLYSTDLVRWFQNTRSALLAFAACAVSGFIAAGLTAYFFKDQVGESWKIAGMLAGLYTGGTPNLQAIGLALETREETIILLNTADVITGTFYLLFLVSFGPFFFKLFLRDFKSSDEIYNNEQQFYTHSFTFFDSLKGIGLTIIIIIITLGGNWIVFGKLDQIIFIILLLTTFSIAVSFLPKFRHLPGNFQTGELFLLGFCTALGMVADISRSAMEGSLILYFDLCVLIGTLTLNILFARLLHIDRDTMMITHVAGIYGPAFVGQIATTIGNRQLAFSGMAMGLLGYAIGNYWGIGLAYLLKWMMG
ncbi:MAG: DUF819 family protein [Saprospiraceae bacterium]